MKTVRVILIIIGGLSLAWATFRNDVLCNALRDSFAINHGPAIRILMETNSFILFGGVCLTVAALLPRKWGMYLEK